MRMSGRLDEASSFGGEGQTFFGLAPRTVATCCSCGNVVELEARVRASHPC